MSLTDAYVNTQVVTASNGKVHFNLYGNLTIAEVIEAYEANANIKVVSASLEGDIVTLEYVPVPHDDPDYDDEGDDRDAWDTCAECGFTGNYHADACPYNYA